MTPTATTDNAAELETMQTGYLAAVDSWIAAIQDEKALAAQDHTVADIDRWEQAGLVEDELRTRAKSAKKRYEDALRQTFYHFQGK